MRVQFTNVSVRDTTPTFGNYDEYAVDDGSGAALVRTDGTSAFTNTFGNAVLGKTQLRIGHQISSMMGVLTYAFNRYKMVPGKTSDFGVVTGVDPLASQVPSQWDLSQNFPNPFNPSTTIRFNTSQYAPVRLAVFNMLGQKVATLVDHELAAGTHQVEFDGSRFTSGVYFYRLTSGSTMMTKRMVLLK
jgi:hypothetical protein